MLEASKRKKKVETALAKLKEERGKKQKRAMEVTEREKKEAFGARKFYVDKIKQMQKLMQSDKFDSYSIHELQDMKQRLSGFRDNFDAKCLALGCVDAESDTSEENEEIEVLCSLLNGKLAKKICELTQPQNEIVDKDMLMQQNTVKEQEIADAQKSTSQMLIAQPDSNASYTFGVFSGKMDEWHRFIKRFKAEIHENNEIDAKQKYDLLMNACHNDAKAIVYDQNNDYANAWQQLNNVYGEAYIQLHFCIMKILETEPLYTPSAEGISYIKNRGAKCVQILKDAMKEKVFDSFVMIMMANKLDPDTARAWERHRLILAESWASDKSTSENRLAMQHLPSWQDFEHFLQSEISVYRKIELRQSVQCATTSQAAQGSSNASYARDDDQIAQNNLHTNAHRSQNAWEEEKRRAPEHQQCTLCDGIHARYKCEVFIRMDFLDKWAHVYGEGLCKRCMHRQHGNTRCVNKQSMNKCPSCWAADDRQTVAYHNSVLCPVKHAYAPGIEPTLEDCRGN